MKNYSIIFDTDSYKYSHHLQYPPGTTHVFSYIESRGGEHDKTVFFGLQIFLKKYLTQLVTMEDVERAKKFVDAHIGPGLFNYDGWKYIVEQHGGRLPVEVKAVEEGTVVPVSNALVTIINTDPKCFWLTSFVETALLRAVWYPTTVATVSHNIKRIIYNALEETGDPNLVNFKLHDFGARGVSSLESAEIGGCAHLVNFMGSDTVPGILAAEEFYGEPMAGFSIPAAEHSTITSWGRSNEARAYANMIEKFAGENKLYAVVSDSYDIFKACEDIWGKELKQKVIGSGGTLVIRPDSGDPAITINTLLNILYNKFDGHRNEKGYKVLDPHVRVIWGDGINEQSIQRIIAAIKLNGFAVDNVAFGMGGALLQHPHRDTQKFAMKCSLAKVNGEWVEVFKDPITDKGKISKKGMLMLIKNTEGFKTIDLLSSNGQNEQNYQLTTVFLDGRLKREYSFSEVRSLADYDIYNKK